MAQLIAINDEHPSLPGTDERHMTAARRDDGLHQMLEQIDEKHSDAHKRLRQDLDRLEEQLNKGLETLREGRQANSARIEKLETSPVDATKLVLNSRVVVTLVIIALGIAASVWNLKSSITEIASKMDNTYKLQELQNSQMNKSIDSMKQRQELQQYELQGVKDEIQGFKAMLTQNAKEKR